MALKSCPKSNKSPNLVTLPVVPNLMLQVYQSYHGLVVFRYVIGFVFYLVATIQNLPRKGASLPSCIWTKSSIMNAQCKGEKPTNISGNVVILMYNLKHSKAVNRLLAISSEYAPGQSCCKMFSIIRNRTISRIEWTGLNSLHRFALGKGCQTGFWNGQLTST